jgi:hypothetical protein
MPVFLRSWAAFLHLDHLGSLVVAALSVAVVFAFHVGTCNVRKLHEAIQAHLIISNIALASLCTYHSLVHSQVHYDLEVVAYSDPSPLVRLRQNHRSRDWNDPQDRVYRF